MLFSFGPSTKGRTMHVDSKGRRHVPARPQAEVKAERDARLLKAAPLLLKVVREFLRWEDLPTRVPRDEIIGHIGTLSDARRAVAIAEGTTK